ncbi:MAG: hypothetical protein IIB04_00795 [Acidobacteria bacterium]|nr:hypothetical protein [Acidobacteriota bacterium]MCH8985132.1 hypothetical protein [Acidobacteriota bacterium]
MVTLLRSSNPAMADYDLLDHSPTRFLAVGELTLATIYWNVPTKIEVRSRLARTGRRLLGRSASSPELDYLQVVRLSLK